MYCGIDYKRKKNQRVKLSSIIQSFLKWINELENQFGKEDETGIIKDSFNFPEMKKAIDELGSNKDGINGNITFRGDATVNPSNMIGALFGRATFSNKVLLDEIQKNRDSNFKNLSIEDVNEKLENKDANAKKLLYQQGEFFKRANKDNSNKIEKIFFENIDNFNNILTNFYNGFNKDKSIDNINMDLKLLQDESKEFAKYLKFRKKFKSSFENVEKKVSKIYKKILKDHKDFKEHFGNTEDPQIIFKDIKDSMTKTKSSMAYDDLIKITTQTRDYLDKFSDGIESYYNRLEKNNPKLKKHTKDKLKFEKDLSELSKSLNEETKKLEALKKAHK